MLLFLTFVRFKSQLLCHTVQTQFCQVKPGTYFYATSVGCKSAKRKFQNKTTSLLTPQIEQTMSYKLYTLYSTKIFTQFPQKIVIKESQVIVNKGYLKILI